MPFPPQHLRATLHAALQWLLTFWEQEGQIGRWIELLQSFDFTTEHHAGKCLTSADALLRRPCAKEDCRYCLKREIREQGLTAAVQEGDKDQEEEFELVPDAEE